tara:strand:+ start:37 stop:378 length:342 start_codon:yes stop_codon:yes gene_type:complete
MKTADLYKDLEYNPKKPLVNVLFETSFTKEIRIAMQEGTQMKEHKTSFPIVVQVIEGVIDFGVNNEVLHLKKGNLIALEPSVPHDLKALENSVVRLTLTKNDEALRVQDVASK